MKFLRLETVPTHQRDPKRSFTNTNLRRTVQKRDKDTCRLCGGACTENHGSMTDQRSYDHDIPHSYGGATEPENISLAHRGCNSTRGNEFEPKKVKVVETVSGTVIPASKKKQYEKRTGTKVEGKSFTLGEQKDPNRTRRGVCIVDNPNGVNSEPKTQPPGREKQPPNDVGPEIDEYLVIAAIILAIAMACYGTYKGARKGVRWWKARKESK